MRNGMTIRVLIAPVAGLMFTVSAIAKDIPAELLDLDRERCQRTCISELDSEPVCKQLCDCTVVEFQERFDYDEYIRVSGDLLQDTVSPADRKILDAIAKKCSANIVWPTEQEPEPAATPE